MRFLHSSTEMNNNLLEGIIRKRIFLLRQMRQEPEVIAVELSPVSCLPHITDMQARMTISLALSPCSVLPWQTLHTHGNQVAAGCEA
jgi:hypothetical protein